jgi:hypothetical protein
MANKGPPIADGVRFFDGIFMSVRGAENRFSAILTPAGE